MEEDINKVRILLQQERYSEAEKLLKNLLSSDPNNVFFLSLLAETNLQQDKLEEAQNLIDSAIGISPNTATLFYIKARILLLKNKYGEAESSLEQSLFLDPVNADYFALFASVKLERKQYEKALELANKALELDAENLLGLNVRSTALLKLDRKEESFQTIEGALREDPNNAYTHSNYGWNLLEKGNHKEALNHFREALKNNPNLEQAQVGMLEAIKANNVFYRIFLKYAFWIGNLTERYQWGFLLAFYFGVRFLRTLANQNEEMRPYLIPLIVFLGLIAFSTWVIRPISNLFLRFNVYGKHLLKRNEILSSNFVAASFLVFLLALPTYFALGDERFLIIALFGFAMMLPYGVMFSPTRYKNALVIYAGGMTLLGLGSVLRAFTTGETFGLLTGLFFGAFVAFQWVANFLLIKEDNV